MVASAAAAVTTIVTAYGLLSAVTPERVAVATATATIPTPIDQLFDALAVDREQAFRSDLERVEVISETRWRELATDSPAVEYEQVRRIPNELFEARFRGRGFRGRWLVRFEPAGERATKLAVYEELLVKHVLLRPVVRASYPLQAAVDRFMADVHDAAVRGAP